jgi:hypothetical protein
MWITDRDGKRVLAEVPPEQCSRGHKRLGPVWGQCPEPTCRVMGRVWRCLEPECAELVVDPEHEHRGSAPLGAHEGG